tara:strand:+ start:145 stop:648 length:504 start_codon:yes stop_codon:yes gene_type:complete
MPWLTVSPWKPTQGGEVTAKVEAERVVSKFSQFVPDSNEPTGYRATRKYLDATVTVTHSLEEGGTSVNISLGETGFNLSASSPLVLAELLGGWSEQRASLFLTWEWEEPINLAVVLVESIDDCDEFDDAASDWRRSSCEEQEAERQRARDEAHQRQVARDAAKEVAA